ncbi:MAG: tRNA dihydrouridine synthase DusB [Bacteroidetes Order II. Incertae sedis bacterium]|nr:tRNA dihydrouridine synthase DusB [Bacteroidetes Order II. bacterium]MBT4051952.1 tRNA dihydrouridine synthase DusB [Bacteroidetes Order II. bacterium]MBT4602643.1 tRNA dihydrouridine synthase DusB [Bacteroidetes Order II. bacterium]MBT5250456.1 tRNA dihydrouridine synthase DusB [Bacteroidetes Order II. bacterium]MBT6199798.1 tRNA dihydrouridine synthase DusB [Bacteroidetes Order II. bacterium]
MQIGPLKFRDRPIFLAPMEDVSDPPFRLMCKRFGADMLYTEFISSGGLAYGAEGSEMKLDIYEEERPVAIQIFGGDIEQVRQATRVVNAVKPDLIDINFGCPVKKVVSKDGGAGILRNLPKMQEITAAVIEESDTPVTVKTRLGWNDQSIFILDVAKMLEETGVAALAVHARTRSQMYKGEARWDWLKKIKNESGISIPLIGNGDATSPEKIEAMFDETGVDAVMVGRGAIGNPWIFRNAKIYRETGEIPPAPTWEERCEAVAEHLALKCEWLGEKKGVLEMRRMYGGYFKGFRNASALRQLIMQEHTLDGVLEVLLNFSEADLETVKIPNLRAVAVKAKLPTATRKKV